MLNQEFYKSPSSNIQFKTISKTEILPRLMSLTMKRFNQRLYEKVLYILNKNTSDDIIYNDLCVVYNSYYNKPSKGIKRPNKNLEIIQILITSLKHFMKFDFEKPVVINYLDVGAGNGRFCKMFGHELNLDTNNIHGIDIPNFSEQGDWNRNDIMNDITFKTINKDDKYPYPDNKFNIITMKMVFHHVENIDLTLNEIKRVLCNEGYLIIIDHDVCNYLDYILCEIEHFYYIKVFDKKRYKRPIQEDDIQGDIDNLGYIKFRNIKETTDIFSTFGFNELKTDHFYENNELLPTRNYWTIFQLNK
jgi:SAM-dependent methyltransferase